MSTLSARAKPPKPQESTPTTKVDYVAPKERNDGEPGALVKNFPNRFPETEHKIADLMTWPETWDASKPNPVSVRRALSWAEELYRDLSAGLWIEPHISADEDGDVVFEWRRNNKKLVVYVSPQAVEYLKIEGSAVDSDIADGTIETPKESRMLWRWLRA